jgi:hypothetical protein
MLHLREAHYFLTIKKRIAGGRSFTDKWKLILVFLFLFPFINAKAQRGVDYAVHANIIYHFTKYIEWPESRRSGDFIIGIIGESPLTDELKKTIANKTARNQKIVVKRISTSQSLNDCHIIFISAEESGSLKKIAAKTAGMSVLLVTEDEGMAQGGSCINFVIVADRLKLEINKNNIDKHSLSIASELLQLGKIVK